MNSTPHTWLSVAPILPSLHRHPRLASVARWCWCFGAQAHPHSDLDLNEENTVRERERKLITIFRMCNVINCYVRFQQQNFLFYTQLSVEEKTKRRAGARTNFTICNNRKMQSASLQIGIWFCRKWLVGFVEFSAWKLRCRVIIGRSLCVCHFEIRWIWYSMSAETMQFKVNGKAFSRDWNDDVWGNLCAESGLHWNISFQEGRDSRPAHILNSSKCDSFNTFIKLPEWFRSLIKSIHWQRQACRKI